MERTSLIKLDKNIIKETSLLAFPIIIQGLVYELQSLTDKAFLGYLKTEYVSAIGAAQLPLNATMDGLVALSVAITIIVAHLYECCFLSLYRGYTQCVFKRIICCCTG